MGNITEDWEPFEIQVTIEGEVKTLLVSDHAPVWIELTDAVS
jgi:hypothetical protein